MFLKGFILLEIFHRRDDLVRFRLTSQITLYSSDNRSTLLSCRSSHSHFIQLRLLKMQMYDCAHFFQLSSRDASVYSRLNGQTPFSVIRGTSRPWLQEWTPITTWRVKWKRKIKRKEWILEKEWGRQERRKKRRGKRGIISTVLLFQPAKSVKVLVFWRPTIYLMQAAKCFLNACAKGSIALSTRSTYSCVERFSIYLADSRAIDTAFLFRLSPLYASAIHSW